MEDILNKVKNIISNSIWSGSIIKAYQEIEKIIKPTDEARSKNAEILTPLSLAQEMIDKVPNKFWKKPIMVFEPTCGKGVFLCLAYDKFIKAGIDRQVILEKCLYFADLNPVNVYICKMLLDPLDNYKLNYYVGDTLKLDVEKEFKIGKFDLVIGNPPYTGSLWKKFTLFAQDICYILVFVVPSSWIIAISQKKFVEWIKLNGLKYIKFLKKTYFNIGIETCYFILENGYAKDIIINDIITSRDTDLCDYTNVIEISIFKKLIPFEKLNIQKGKNKTLNYHQPKETKNVHFLKSKVYDKRLVSRLGGGKEEIYWCKDLVQLDRENHKLLFPRGTASYNSRSRILDTSRTIVYSRYSHREYLSTGIVYFTENTQDKIKNLKKYLDFAKLVRYLFIKKNSASELTKGFCMEIPKIPFDINMNDKAIFTYFKFSKEEITHLLTEINQ